MAAVKSVRFSSSDNLSLDDDEEGPKKRPRIERFSQDEDDDIDEWVNDEDDDAGLPSERDLVNAKRNRRLKRQGQDFDDDSEDDTSINNDTSLMAEKTNGDGDDDIPVEPFNMKAESTDGSGYFEGDTYVFRRSKEDGEPDAWFDSLNDGNKKATFAKPKVKVPDENDADDWTQEELYARILPLVSDSETILQALVRYGDLIKRQPEGETRSLSQTALNDLTVASNALLLQGDVDIYQKTRKDIMQMVPEQQEKPTQEPGPVVMWEYKGNQDHQIHGLYTTQEMVGWTQAGYFIGAQAVQIRTVTKGEAPKASMSDELLSDLMDDDEKEPLEVRGEWVSSNDVNFMAYS
jgi:GYF domain